MNDPAQFIPSAGGGSGGSEGIKATQTRQRIVSPMCLDLIPRSRPNQPPTLRMNFRGYNPPP